MTHFVSFTIVIYKLYNHLYKMLGKKRKYVLAASKKTYKKRRVAASSTPFRIFKNPKLPFPGKMTVSLQYFDDVNVNAGVAVPATYVMSANGMFDPNISGVGHQPRGFDQYMGLYERYTVNSCTIRVIGAQNDQSANNSIGFLAVVPCNSNPFSVGQLNDIFEAVDCKYSVFSLNSAIGGLPEVTNYVNIKQYLGKKDLLDDDACSGDATQNPADQVYFHIFYGSTSTVSDPANCQIMISLTYNVTFTRPREIGRS